VSDVSNARGLSRYADRRPIIHQGDMEDGLGDAEMDGTIGT